MNETLEVVNVNPFAANVAARPANDESSAVARTDQARAVAEVQARLLLCKKFPRDPMTATDKIINAFTRPTLAEAAKYQYARGGSSIDGPSIRSAEAIAQLWGNIEFGFRELSRGTDSDGVTYSEVEAYACDLESMTRRPVTFRVRHWRDTKTGGYKLKDERDIYELTSNMAQRRVRACILAVIPGDVVEAAMNQAEATLHAKADTSPEAVQKMVAAFEPYGVTRDQLAKRIQRRLDAITPAQMVGLKKIWASLRDGMSVANEWFDPATPAPGAQPAAAAPTSGNEGAKAALAKRSAAAKAAKIDAETGEISDAEKPPLKSYAQYAERIATATASGNALEVLEEARKAGMPLEMFEELKNVFERRWG
jgi:hypothetical protein